MTDRHFSGLRYDALNGKLAQVVESQEFKRDILLHGVAFIRVSPFGVHHVPADQVYVQPRRAHVSIEEALAEAQADFICKADVQHHSQRTEGEESDGVSIS